MPEVINTSMQRVRPVSETTQLVETIVDVLTTLDLLKIINETINLIEDDGFGIAYNWSIATKIQIDEVALRAIGVAEGVAKVINETLQISESVTKAIIQQINEIIRIVHESISFNEALNLAKQFIRIRTERQQISETRIGSLTEVLVKVISETLQIPETIVDKLIGVTLELTKVISETLQISTTSVRALRLVRRKSEVLQLLQNSLELVFVLGQVVGLFKVISAVEGLFRVNKNVE